ncbi:efflux RND transporter periplasmic adaptor subunit [Shewanella waksmanii]|uniref:efflux RND transporter periplasmic adaptor subunit n=1 Tax=Shewanella waksmanii TaxID=213783 RepID=UPI0004B53814|nr:efflux RND transporter periplasmic adaptor subunit [Shewanella waksmanii]
MKPIHYSTLFVALMLTTACSQETTNDPKPSQPVAVMTVNASHLNHDLRFSGVLESQQQARLAFRVAGTIESIHVDAGDEVKAGQLLAALDPHDYQVRVAELEARLSEAQASHKQAVNELARTEFARSGNAISSVSLDRAKTSVARAQAGIDVIEQNLTQAKDALKYTRLTAPFDGVIGKRNFDAFEQVSPGIPAFVLHQPEVLQAVIDVPEPLLQHFYQGKRSRVYANNDPMPILGTVTEIATIPDTIKRTFSASILLDNSSLESSDRAIYPGMVISARISDSNSQHATCIPATALYTVQNQPYITKIEANTSKRVAVEVLRQGRKTSCVEGDIQLNDRLIVAGAAFVQDGTTIDNILDAGVL